MQQHRQLRQQCNPRQQQCAPVAAPQAYRNECLAAECDPNMALDYDDCADGVEAATTKETATEEIAATAGAACHFDMPAKFVLGNFVVYQTEDSHAIGEIIMGSLSLSSARIRIAGGGVLGC